MTDDTSDFAQLQEFAQRRDELDPFLLRAALANTLRRRGYRAIVAPDDGNSQAASTNRAPGVVALLVLWGFSVSAAFGLGLEWYLVPVSLVATTLVVLAAIQLTHEAAWTGVVLILGWMLAGILEGTGGDSGAFLVGYVFPIALALSYAFAARLLRLRDAQDVALALAGVVKSAPLIAPVVLIVLFLPSLSADVWRIAGRLDAESIAVVGTLSVGLLFLVVRLHLGSQLEQMIEQRAAHLSNSSARVQLTRNQVLTVLGEEEGLIVADMSDGRIDSSWPPAGEEYAPYLRAAAGDTLISPLTGRLAVTVGVVGVLFSAYVYALCLAVVPLEIAADWSEATVSSHVVSAFGVQLTFHSGPYVALAVLLGLAATATFLSFALVEDRFATAMTDALLRDPTDRFLVLALPYVSLWEAAIELGRAARQVSASVSDGSSSGVDKSSGNQTGPS
jgi:hypothetical protein